MEIIKTKFNFLTIICFYLLCTSCNYDKQEAKQQVYQEYFTETIDKTKSSGSHQNVVNKKAPSILKEFYNLIGQERYAEALSVYEKNTGDFLVYLKTSTEMFRLHLDVVNLYNKLYDEESALKKSIEILEFSEILTTTAMEFAENEYTPDHYEHLVYTLFSLYMESENWSKAQKQCDNLLVYIAKREGEKSSDYATVLFNQAMLYSKMGNMVNALKTMQISREIYELTGMKNTREWENCTFFIKKWSED